MKIATILISLFLIAAPAITAAQLQGNVSEEESLRVNREAPQQRDISIQSLFPSQAMPPVVPPRASALQGWMKASTYQAAYTNSLAVNAPTANDKMPRSPYVSGVAANGGNLLDTTEFNTTLPTAQHGESPIGVLGLKVDFFTGRVLQVFPPSDLKRFQIRPGDRVLGYMGHQFTNGWQMVEEVVGIPGTPCEITFLHNGRIISIQALRTDARLLVQYDSQTDACFNHYHNCAAQTRYW